MVRHFRRQWGLAHIGIGLLIILAAQFWVGLPMVTAIALVGRGTVLTLRLRPRTHRQDSLIMYNLSVYGTLVCLAIVTQSNAVLQTTATHVSLSMLFDHAAAIVILVGLLWTAFSRLCQPAA